MASLLDLLGQTWPARLAQSAWGAAKLPGDVYAGRVDPLSNEGIGRATDLAGMVMGGTFATAPKGALGAGPGIRAYHGSPHDFGRFDMSKIGTGEGAQAYGHGLYFAENPAVAAEYRKSLAQGELHPAAREKYGPPLAHAKAAFEREADEFNNALISAKTLPDAKVEAARARSNAARQQWDDVLTQAEREFGPPGHSYEVNIRANPEDFVDWERLSPAAQRELKNPASAKRLGEAGYPGVRYLDQGSRERGEGTRNYVLFRDDIIDIVKKYGWAGLAAFGIGEDEAKAAGIKKINIGNKAYEGGY